MTFWRCFRTQLSWTHHIGDDRPELADKACLAEHTHPSVYLELRLGTSKWVDFKTIKQIFWKTMKEFVNESKDVKLNDEGEVVHANIGAMDVEEFIKEFKSLIRSNFGLYGLKNYKLQLKMWETSKYGVFDDGVC